LRGIAGGAAALVLGRAHAAEPLATTDVGQGVTLIGGAGGNVLVVATDAGQVVVDSGMAGARDALVEALRDLPGGRVTALFNTHWHLEQIGANAALGEQGATIYAHAKTRQRLSAGYYVPTEDRYEAPLAAAGRPTQSFHTEGTVTVGTRRIDYGYLLEAHTDGDIYVHFPDANVVAVGDAVAPERDPVLDWFGGGWLGGRIDSLEKLLTLGDRNTRFVPSYGAIVGRATLEAEHKMHVELFGRMVEHVRRGETAADMLEAGVLDGLGRTFADPAKFLYDLHKGFWAHHNALMHDIV
jgi:glyoxylase-like metal-dependent hydrolase (beta-lactamase superfamily II)